MAIVIKGASRGSPVQMARYALDQGKNEVSIIHEVKNTVVQDVRGAMEEMAAIASATRCRDFLYHAQINPEKDDHLTTEQWKQAVEQLEKNLDLEDHQRIVFEHVKQGRQHYHVVWSRIDVETLKAVNMGNNYLAHEQTAVELEKAFGLEPLARRPNLEGGRKGDRAGESWEYKQAEHYVADIRAMKDEVKALREASATGVEFATALAEHGYTLAKGDRRDFMIIDPSGGMHSLGRYADMKAADLRKFMRDMDPATIPTIQELRDADKLGTVFEHKASPRHPMPEVPLGKTMAAIFESYQRAGSAEDFAEMCRADGIHLARITAAEAQQNLEVRAQAQADGLKRKPVKLHEGEIVAVNQYGSIYRINERTTGADSARVEEFNEELERSVKLPSLNKATENARRQYEQQQAAKQVERERKKEAARLASQERKRDKEHGGAAQTIKSFVTSERTTHEAAEVERKKAAVAKPPVEEHRAVAQTRPVEQQKAPVQAVAKEQVAPVKEEKVAPKLVGRIANSAALIVEEVLGLLEFLAPSPPPREITPQEMFRSAEARAERMAQLEQQERRDRSLRQIEYDYKTGRGIDREDLRNLDRDQLEEIAAHGIDDGLKQLINDLDRHRGRHLGR